MGNKGGHESSNHVVNSSSDFPSGLRELESVKFPSVNGSKMKSSSRLIGSMMWLLCPLMEAASHVLNLMIQIGLSVGWSLKRLIFRAMKGTLMTAFAVLVPCYGGGRCEKRVSMKRQVMGDVTQRYGFSSDGNFTDSSSLNPESEDEFIAELQLSCPSLPITNKKDE